MTYKAYISITDDLKAAGDAQVVQKALYMINEFALPALVAEDDAAAGDQRHDNARDLIRQCDVFIGVYGAEYGEVPPGKTAAHIELEYRFAVEAGKPIILFIQSQAAKIADERQQIFLNYVVLHHIINYFDSDDVLAAKVKLAMESFRETMPLRRLQAPALNLRDLTLSPPPAPRQEAPTVTEGDDTTEEEARDFAETVHQALAVAQDDLEQIVRRALELHDAQHHVSNMPPEDYDNRVMVSPLWGEPLRRSQFQSDIFMIMPFRPQFDAVYQAVIRPLSADLNMTIKRGDDFTSTRGSIIQEVWAALNACRLVIVETTEVNANVYYELGIAHTLGKPAILLTQTDEVEKLPFDIRHLRFIVYDDSPGGHIDLEKNLRNAIIWLMNDLAESGNGAV